MPVTIEPPQEPVALPHKLWTREECAVLERTGLVDLDRFELIEGGLIQKTPKNPPHSRALKLLVAWLEDLFGRSFVMAESSIDLHPEDSPTSEPEPDVVVLTLSFLDLPPGTRARAAELRLVAEVSSSSLAFDLVTKAQLYARSGIPEYWVLDLESRRLVVHREPAEGKYGSVYAYREDESVAPLAALGSPVRVGEFLR
ncbi:MAG: Uma2 family endonuclease [Bryobacteraceae bacterium]|nr:Uma2 family endonuclease [Bryobacteraceae bacterium]